MKSKRIKTAIWLALLLVAIFYVTPTILIKTGDNLAQDDSGLERWGEPTTEFYSGQDYIHLASYFPGFGSSAEHKTENHTAGFIRSVRHDFDGLIREAKEVKKGEFQELFDELSARFQN